jgi:ribokinase
MSQRAAKNARVFVVGSSNTDLVVDVGRLPRAGETVLGADLSTFAGGKGANQAVAAARAGASVVFIGAFGDDEHGRQRRADLERDGIDCSAARVLRGKPSGVALIARAPGDNSIVVAPGANAALSPRDVKRGLRGLSEHDVLLCSLEVPLEAALEATSFATGRGARVIVNPAPLPPAGLPDELLSCVDVLTPNEHELRALVGGKRPQRALERALGNLGPHLIFVITRGARGIDLFAGGVYWKNAVSAPRVKAVDTVGAGDCFSGALAAALARAPEDLTGALRFAVAASALSVTRPGAQASLPRRREIQALLSSEFPEP